MTVKAAPRVTLEDLLACWRAAMAVGGADADLAAEATCAIVREARFTQTTPDATLPGDRSLAAAADRLRLRAKAQTSANFSNPDQLRALAAVALTLSHALRSAES